ncbi:M16 family metallopeptidase [Ascidiimonas sp. W6]|uniref:M16 family metallopeptidase n=1 Tax=Ascidiimonas meishanensis TaxID=3128903 RepID=UPI0030EC8888
MKRILFTLLILCAFTINAQVDRSKQPKAGPAPKIKLGNPQTFELPNGLKVLLVENHKLPRVAYTLTIDNPPYAEGSKAGVSGLMGSLLGKGSLTIDKDTFEEEVDYMGARMSFNSSGGFARGLSKYSERILQLMADAAINPNFTDEEFQKEKDKLLESIKSNEKSVTSAARRVESALAYGQGHPYGEFTTRETVGNVKLNDVKNHYSNFFVPKNAYLVVVGDIDYKELRKNVTKYFSEWKAASPLTVSYSKPAPVQYTQLNFVDMPNAVQSEITVQNVVDLKKTDEDYFPALIANNILGGGSKGMLFSNLREDKGFTYGAYSRLSSDKYAARFRAFASVRNEVTDSAVMAFLEEINKIRDQKVSTQDLVLAKADYTGNFIMALEKPETIARYALAIETDNLPKDFYTSYLQNINAVTAEQVQKAAQKYFKANNARIVVTGKGSDVIEKLENFSFNGKKIPLSYYDKYAKATEKPDYSAGIPEGTTTTTILQKYIDAIGGAEKLQAVNSVYINAEGSMQGMVLNLEMKTTKENQFSMDMKMNGGSMMKQVFDGDGGFMVAQGQKRELPADQIAGLKAESVPFPELIYLTNENVKLEGIEDIDGKKAYAIKVSDKKVNYYDLESGLKVKSVTTVEGQGQSMKQALGIKNYKEVSGILFPFTLSQSFGPQSIDFEVKELKVNEGVSEADFK